MDAVEMIEVKAAALRAMLDKLNQRDNDGQFDDKWDVIRFVTTYVEAVEEMVPAKPAPVEWLPIGHCGDSNAHQSHTYIISDVPNICPGGSYGADASVPCTCP